MLNTDKKKTLGQVWSKDQIKYNSDTFNFKHMYMYMHSTNKYKYTL